MSSAGAEPSALLRGPLHRYHRHKEDRETGCLGQVHKLGEVGQGQALGTSWRGESNQASGRQDRRVFFALGQADSSVAAAGSIGSKRRSCQPSPVTPGFLRLVSLRQWFPLNPSSRWYWIDEPECVSIPRRY